MHMRLADEDMNFRFHHYMERHDDYRDSMRAFKRVYKDWIDAKDNYMDSYAHLKKSYLTRCGPLQNLLVTIIILHIR